MTIIDDTSATRCPSFGRFNLAIGTFAFAITRFLLFSFCYKGIGFGRSVIRPGIHAMGELSASILQSSRKNRGRIRPESWREMG
jgi:hypothetical protein